MNASAEPVLYRGLPAIQLRAPDGGTAVVTDFGAHVVSWQPQPGDERLYLSELAVFDGTAPIRGGIPVIFPQFGTAGPLPRHGLVRTRAWRRGDVRAADDYVQATWSCTPDDTSMRVWPAEFLAELTVCLNRQRLDVELYVENTGTAAFTFTGALHTYCATSEVEHTSLEGLGDAEYIDQTRGGTRRKQRESALLVAGEVDRIYVNPSPELMLRSPRHALAVEQSGFPDTVVWNPWVEKCASFRDMPPTGFRRMLCVEAAAAVRPVNVPAGGSWVGRQSLVPLR